MRTRVKICGVMRPEDAAVAAELGADAVGIVLYPQSKRYVAPEAAREIVPALPVYVTAAALFVNETTEEMRRVADLLGARHLQLQGNESAEQIAELREYSIIKAVRVRRERFAEDVARWKTAIGAHGLSNLGAILLETDSKLHGGSGIENDWETVTAARDCGALNGLPSIVAAGGLRADNVAAVIKTLRPFAVDLSSGVEGEFGRKSREKIEGFMREVRAADGTCG